MAGTRPNSTSFVKGDERRSSGGRGRPKGATAKLSIKALRAAGMEAVAEAEARGISPLAYMIKVLADPKSTRREKMWAATAAAPYIHKKQAIAIEGGDRPVRFEEAMGKSREQFRDSLMAFVVAAASAGDDPNAIGRGDVVAGVLGQPEDGLVDSGA